MIQLWDLLDVLLPIGPEARACCRSGTSLGVGRRQNEPGSADFHYGEMKMRRHGTEAPLGKQLLLSGHWTVSG